MAALAAVVSCQPPVTDRSTVDASPASSNATVIAVRDGDTVEVDVDSNGSIDVRLVGINAPENDECHHRQSREYLAERVEGKRILLETTGTDQFGRALGHIWVGSDHVNVELVRKGFAIATTPNESDPFGDLLLSAEADAARSGAGLWSVNACGASGSLPEVSITRVDENPQGPDDQHIEHESVTITNNGEDDVDLSGWILRDESSRHRYRFPPGTTLAAGGRLIVTSAAPAWDPGGSPVWNNSGDLVLLTEATGRVVDSVRY